MSNFQLTESEIRAMFHKLDTDRSGQISLSELHEAAREGRLGLVQTDSLCIELMTAADTDGDEHISFAEFQAFVRSREEYLKSLFTQIDSQGEQDGHITVDELTTFMSNLLGKQVDPKEAEKLLRQLDTDQSGTVEYEELLRGALWTAGDASKMFDSWGCHPDHFYLHVDSGKQCVPTPPHITVLAGLISGAITATVICPLDVTKTRLQVQGSASIKQGGGVMGVMRHILATDGVKGLYRGLSPTLMALLPNWAVYFTTYDTLKSTLHKSMGDSTGPVRPSMHMLAASGAGAATILVTNPIWVVKTRIQTQDIPAVMEQMGRAPYKGALNALYRITMEEGFSGLYSGLIPSLVGVVHVAIQFPLYEYLKSSIAESKDISTDELQALDLVASSGASKLVAATITYPHEVVRSQMHISGSASLTGCLTAMRSLWMEDGIKAYYRGCLTNLCRTTPAAALTFTSFELVSRALKGMLLPKGDK